jgi:putative endonuclease
VSYFVYILQCADGSLYTGSTNNLKKRLVEHNFSKRGAKYTKSRRPVVLRYKEKHATLSQALSREAALKRLTRKQKLAFLNSVS